MSYFDSPENVENYIQMADGYDGRDLVQRLKKILAPDSSVLELGMGPGKDLLMLGECYHATGSDNSSVFLERFRKEHPQADLLQLDAVKMDTSRTFDCVYSNKVLHHLSPEELSLSFKNQRSVLKNGGILFHTFWYGDKKEVHEGMQFFYYTKESLLNVLGDSFEIFEFEQYTEMEENDSFFVILKLRQQG